MTDSGQNSAAGSWRWVWRDEDGEILEDSGWHDNPPSNMYYHDYIAHPATKWETVKLLWPNIWLIVRYLFGKPYVTHIALGTDEIS